MIPQRKKEEREETFVAMTETLPIELNLIVMDFLDVRTIYRCVQPVCRFWRTLSLQAIENKNPVQGYPEPVYNMFGLVCWIRISE